MNKQDLINYVEDKYVENKEVPQFNAGDTVAVDYTIREGNKERIQTFQGTVIQVKGKGVNKKFTVRKISTGIGIERIFTVSTPSIARIRVLKHGKVRQSRIYYFHNLRGKKAKIPEKR